MNTLSLPLQALGVAQGVVVFGEGSGNPIPLLEYLNGQELLCQFALQLGKQEEVIGGQVRAVERVVLSSQSPPGWPESS